MISQSATNPYRLKSWILASITSLLLFSPYTYEIFSISGAYSFELALLLTASFFTFTRSNIGALVVKLTKKALPFLGLPAATIFAALLIGIINYQQPTASYADARANAFVVFGALLAWQFLKYDARPLLIFAACSTTLSLIYWTHQYLTESLSTKSPSPLFACVIGIILATELARARYIIFFVCTAIFLAAVSGFRQYWIITILAITIGLIELYKNKFINWYKIVPIILFVGIATYIASSFIWEILNRNESSYIQSIAKATDAVTWIKGGDSSDSDNLRLSYFIYMLERWDELILPHGLGHSAHGVHFDSWFYNISDASNTLDSVLLFIAYQYGYIVLIPLLFFIVKRIWAAQSKRGLARFILLFLILLVPLLFDGGQLTVTIRSFWFGAFLAYLMWQKNTPRKFGRRQFTKPHPRQLPYES